jgi:hypothetical protein
MSEIRYTTLSKRPCFSEKCKGQNVLHQIGFQPSTGKRFKACVACELVSEICQNATHPATP